MIGDQHFKVLTAGEEYELSDGTMIKFLTRINLCGVTNEEVVGVLLHRLRSQSRMAACKETSRCITKLEEVEEILWRREVNKNRRERDATPQLAVA